MTSQNKVLVRVKTERNALNSESERSHHVGGQSYKRLRQQFHNGNETIQGNEELRNGEEDLHDIVKQESVDETCNSPHNAASFSSGRRRFRNRSESMYEFSEKILLETVKAADHSDCEPRLERASDYDSPTRPEKIRIPSRETESHLFPWPSEEEMRCLRLEEGKSPLRPSQNRVSYSSYPDKSSFSRFQSPPTINSYFAEGIPERQRPITRRMMEEVVNPERQQIIQYENTKRLSPDFGNANEEKREARTITTNEDFGSSSPLKRAPSPGRIEQNGYPQKAHSIQLNEKANITCFGRKDEEPVWKTYQWYRDRKRPYTQQGKRHKVEQTIFMQYNEIRDKRCQEGRVVNDKRRFSVAEPAEALGNSFKGGRAFSSFRNTSPSVQSASSDASEYPEPSVLTHTSSESSPAKLRKLSNNPTSLHGENARRKGCDRTEFKRKSHTGLHFNLITENVQRVDGEENSNFEEYKETQRAVYRKNVEPRNGVATPVNDDEFCTAHNDKDLGVISSTTYENDTRVLPESFRRCPQDAAKILRLSRIVNNVRNNRDGRLPSSTQKELLLEGQERRHSNDDDVERASEDGQYPMENVLSSPEGNSRRGQMKRFEVRLDCLGSNDSDQESFLDGQTVLHDEDTVCQVNGLLSLPGFKETKYNISLEELKRRMNPPETLTRVEMISYLRQAKSSGRFLLDRYNIVTANRSHPTILSRLCEGEAQVLADGILKMNREYLPLATLARKTVEAYKDDGCKVVNCEDCRLKLRRRIVDVEITRNSLKELLKVIEETKKEDGFQTFEHASHNFGLPNFLNHISLLDDYFKLLLLTLQDE